MRLYISFYYVKALDENRTPQEFLNLNSWWPSRCKHLEDSWGGRAL